VKCDWNFFGKLFQIILIAISCLFFPYGVEQKRGFADETQKDLQDLKERKMKINHNQETLQCMVNLANHLYDKPPSIGLLVGAAEALIDGIEKLRKPAPGRLFMVQSNIWQQSLSLPLLKRR